MQTLFCVSWLLSISLTPNIIAQVDTDGDGLLDVVDATGFDPVATGALRLIELGIQDLDGASLLTGLQELLLDNNRITSVEPGDFGLASPRDFEAPSAWYEERTGAGLELVAKFRGRLWQAIQTGGSMSATSGYVIVTKEENVIVSPMSVEDGVKTVMSGGIVPPTT